MAMPPAIDVFLADGRINPECHTPQVARVLDHALKHAERSGWDSVRTPHIVIGLLSNPDAAIRDWCRRLRVDARELQAQFEAVFRSETTRPQRLQLHREFLSDNAIRVLRDTFERSRRAGRKETAPIDLLLTVLAPPAGIVGKCFERIGFTPDNLLQLAILTESRHLPQ
jgi:ATP-dependent Clp protease ATP-binding subunit ClpA